MTFHIPAVMLFALACSTSCLTGVYSTLYVLLQNKEYFYRYKDDKESIQHIFTYQVGCSVLTLILCLIGVLCLQ